MFSNYCAIKGNCGNGMDVTCLLSAVVNQLEARQV